MTIQDVFDSSLARAARALVGISTWYIADETGIERNNIRQFERGVISLPDHQQEAIKHVLLEHGALFLPDSQDAGYGVRLQHSMSKTRQIQQWESEGGLAGENDT